MRLNDKLFRGNMNFKPVLKPCVLTPEQARISSQRMMERLNKMGISPFGKPANFKPSVVQPIIKPMTLEN